MAVEILCPKCNWKPDGGSYWQCSCNHVWNTFATAGRCPQCHKVWQDTQCPPHVGGCSAWSPHLDWYKGLDEEMRREIEKILKSEPVTAMRNLNQEFSL